MGYGSGIRGGGLTGNGNTSGEGGSGYGCSDHIVGFPDGELSIGMIEHCVYFIRVEDEGQLWQHDRVYHGPCNHRPVSHGEPIPRDHD